MKSKYIFIAEVKTASPFGWKSKLSWNQLFELANNYGDMISIHTDPLWSGSFQLIAKARKLTDKPILAKGIHADDSHIRQALEAGADKVLVVGRLPGEKLLDRCIIEPLALQDLSGYPKGIKVLWNSRDLATGGLKQESFEQARSLWNGWLCQASNIRYKINVQTGADAILVGTHLPEFIRSL